MVSELTDARVVTEGTLEAGKGDESAELHGKLLAESGLQKPRAGDPVPDRFIVALKEKPGQPSHGGTSKLDGILGQFRLDPRNQPDTVVYKHAINGFAARLTPAQKQALENDPDVAFVEQDRVVARNPVSRQLLPQGRRGPESTINIARIEGDKSPTANTAGGVDVDIAVIDTGINLRHPDLNVVKDKSFVPGVKTGDDDDGHGSHVAGIIGAKKNGMGVVGVAPGARLWALKALDKDGNGSWSQIIAAVDYVTENADKIEVVNMSLGDKDKSRALDEAISRSVDAGVTYVVAAGNEGEDSSQSIPANHPRVLTVSAVADGDGKGGGLGKMTCDEDKDEKDDSLATWSNFGRHVRIGAPGVCIESASKRVGSQVDTYEVMSGTSMASPHVAGAAGLVKASHKGYKPDQVIDTLLKNAKPQSDPLWGFSGDKDGYAEPMLNVGKL